MSTLLELKDWLEQGGKIKRSVWSGWVYYKGGAFYNEQGDAVDLVSVDELFATDWEKVEEDNRWKPAIGDKYYAVIGCFSYTWANDVIDRRMFEAYNCFKTKEEVEKARDLWLADRELRSLSDGGEYFLCFDEEDNEFYISDRYISCSPYCFSSFDKAEQAIKQLGKDKLKLIWGVK